MLDGQRAVDRTHADGGQRVERVDAEDDLLERATWDRTYDHDVALVERHLARAHPESIRDAGHHAGHGREGAFVPATGERALQPLGVPAAGRADDRCAHARQSSRGAAGVTGSAAVSPVGAVVLQQAVGVTSVTNRTRGESRESY